MTPLSLDVTNNTPIQWATEGEKSIFDLFSQVSTYNDKSFLLLDGVGMSLTPGFQFEAGVDGAEFHVRRQEYLTTFFERRIGEKQYELKDHLGNVRSVISDILIPNAGTGGYDPQVISYSNYYPFGLTMGTISRASAHPVPVLCIQLNF